MENGLRMFKTGVEFILIGLDKGEVGIVLVVLRSNIKIIWAFGPRRELEPALFEPQCTPQKFGVPGVGLVTEAVGPKEMILFKSLISFKSPSSSPRCPRSFKSNALSKPAS